MAVSSSELTRPPLTVGAVLDLGGLTISAERDGDVDVLALSGELDVASAWVVETQLRCLEEATCAGATIVLDLRGLTFIDSTGLRLLIEAAGRAEVAPHRLRLMRPRKDVFRVCEIAGLDTLLPFEAEEAGDRDV